MRRSEDRFLRAGINREHKAERTEKQRVFADPVRAGKGLDRIGGKSCAARDLKDPHAGGLVLQDLIGIESEIEVRTVELVVQHRTDPFRLFGILRDRLQQIRKRRRLAFGKSAVVERSDLVNEDLQRASVKNEMVYVKQESVSLRRMQVFEPAQRPVRKVERTAEADNAFLDPVRGALGNGHLAPPDDKRRRSAHFTDGGKQRVVSAHGGLHGFDQPVLVDFLRQTEQHRNVVFQRIRFLHTFEINARLSRVKREFRECLFHNSSREL